MIDPRSLKMGDKSSHRNSLKRYVALSSGAPGMVASPSHEAFFERFAWSLGAFRIHTGLRWMQMLKR